MHSPSPVLAHPARQFGAQRAVIRAIVAQ